MLGIAGFKDMTPFTKVVNFLSIYSLIPGSLADGAVLHIVVSVQLSSLFMMFYLHKTGQYWKKGDGGTGLGGTGE